VVLSFERAEVDQKNFFQTKNFLKIAEKTFLIFLDFCLFFFKGKFFPQKKIISFHSCFQNTEFILFRLFLLKRQKISKTNCLQNIFCGRGFFGNPTVFGFFRKVLRNLQRPNLFLLFVKCCEANKKKEELKGFLSFWNGIFFSFQEPKIFKRKSYRIFF